MLNKKDVLAEKSKSVELDDESIHNRQLLILRLKIVE